MSQCQCKIDPEQIVLEVMAVETRIRLDGISKEEKAKLYCQLGKLHHLMGDSEQTKVAFAQAKALDPKIQINDEEL
jgi:hypothetical protein